MKKILTLVILTSALISCQNSNSSLEYSSNASRGEIEAPAAMSGIDIPSELTD